MPRGTRQTKLKVKETLKVRKSRRNVNVNDNHMAAAKKRYSSDGSDGKRPTKHRRKSENSGYDESESELETVQFVEGDSLVQIAVNEQEDQSQFPSDGEDDEQEFSDDSEGEEGELHDGDDDNLSHDDGVSQETDEEEVTKVTMMPHRKVVNKSKAKLSCANMEQKIDELSETIKSMQEFMRAQGNANEASDEGNFSQAKSPRRRIKSAVVASKGNLTPKPKRKASGGECDLTVENETKLDNSLSEMTVYRDVVMNENEDLSQTVITADSEITFNVRGKQADQPSSNNERSGSTSSEDHDLVTK